MKIWYGHGSEHSMNLVMIGHFQDVSSAAQAKEVIDQLTEQVRTDEQAGLIEVGGQTDRFPDGMLERLQHLRVHILSPADLEQFCYDFDIKLKDSMIVLKTDESDVSAFLKVMIDKGARVEVYSAHEYPDTPYGRGK